MNQGMIPNVGDRGTYTLKAPWIIDQKGDYTCVALRSFKEITQNKIDVFETFYQPKGISQAQYKTDTESGVVIVALRASSGSFIYVPSSYILGVPNGNGYSYSRRILTVELGPLPTGLDTAAIQGDIKTLVNARFGVDPTLKEVELPITEIVTPENHMAFEKGRAGRIKSPGNTETMYKELLLKHERVLQENKSYVDKLIELGVIEV